MLVGGPLITKVNYRILDDLQDEHILRMVRQMGSWAAKSEGSSCL